MFSFNDSHICEEQLFSKAARKFILKHDTPALSNAVESVTYTIWRIEFAPSLSVILLPSLSAFTLSDQRKLLPKSWLPVNVVKGF